MASCASEARPTWPHVRLHPLTFDNLALVAPPEGADSAHPDQSHSAELWLGLAQAALAGDARPSDRGAIEHDPEAIARAIDARDGAEAYDQVVTGYLLQIAQTLRTASGAEADALRARTSGLIAALQPGTLRRLLRTSRGGSGRHTFVRDAVQGLRGDAVLEVLKATADVNGETISHGLLRMLTKLAAQAERGAQANRAVAEDALRGQVTSLLADWQLADPNPESYSRLLQLLATSPQDGAEPCRQRRYRRARCGSCRWRSKWTPSAHWPRKPWRGRWNTAASALRGPARCAPPSLRRRGRPRCDRNCRPRSARAPPGRRARGFLGARSRCCPR